MSAATSGFELPLKILPMTNADMTGFEAGRRLHQRNRVCGSAQKRFSAWYIRKLKNGAAEIAPLRGLHFLDVKCMSRNGIKTDFVIRNRDVC